MQSKIRSFLLSFPRRSLSSLKEQRSSANREECKAKYEVFCFHSRGAAYLRSKSKDNENPIKRVNRKLICFLLTKSDFCSTFAGKKGMKEFLYSQKSHYFY
jgi:hypothetical protein